MNPKKSDELTVSLEDAIEIVDEVFLRYERDIGLMENRLQRTVLLVKFKAAFMSELVDAATE